MGNFDEAVKAMPIYEYKCPKCGRVVERIVQGKEPHLICVDCGDGTIMKRVQFSRPGDPAFKGTGFYATDYKGKP